MFQSGRENKEGIQGIVRESIASSKGLIKFHFTEITVVMAIKCRSMRRGAISFPPPASLVRKGVDNAEEWKQGTPSPPLHLPSIPFLRRPPLPPDSLSISASGSNPDWDYRHKRSINKSRRLTLCRLRRLRCSFPGDLDWLRRFTQERGWDCLCLSS